MDTKAFDGYFNLGVMAICEQTSRLLFEKIDKIMVKEIIELILQTQLCEFHWSDDGEIIVVDGRNYRPHQIALQWALLLNKQRR